MNLFHLLDTTARRYPNHGAVFRGADLVWTYGALRERALKLAGGLATLAKPGDRVVVAAKNDPETLVVMFATWAAGLVFTPVNAKLHVREIGVVVDDAEPAWLLSDSGLFHALYDPSRDQRARGRVRFPRL